MMDKATYQSEIAIQSLFTDVFMLKQVEHGITQVEDKPPWRSAWFWFQRRYPE